MKLPLLPSVLVAIAAAAFPVLAGCSRSDAASSSAAAPEPPSIPVLTVEPQLRPDEFVFTGRIEVVQRVELRPRVTGIIEEVFFPSGGEVGQGDLLFTLDARPFIAHRDQARAEVLRAEAAARVADRELARAARMHQAAAISAEEFERRQGAAEEAQAALAAAQAALAAAQLQVDYTRVRAPISGRISRTELTPGNLAEGDQTLLAQLVTDRRLRVRFAVEEALLPRLLTAGTAGIAVQPTGLSGPIDARLEYVSPLVDPLTGTAEVRADLTDVPPALLDGMFARVNLSLPPRPGAVLVPETALGSSSGQRYVLVADAAGRLERRAVELGPRFGPQRALLAGVAPGESVVLGGLQFLQPGMTIRPVTPAAAAVAVAVHGR